MMKNKVLSKKVLSTLLTMSCVYLGGTFEPPMAEAAAVYNPGTITDTDASIMVWGQNLFENEGVYTVIADIQKKWQINAGVRFEF